MNWKKKKKINKNYKKILFKKNKNKKINNLKKNYKNNIYKKNKIYKKISRLSSDLLIKKKKTRINTPIYQTLFKTHRPKSKSINFNLYNNNNEKKINNFYKVYSKEEIKKLKQKNEFEEFINFNNENINSNFKNFFKKK